MRKTSSVFFLFAHFLCSGLVGKRKSILLQFSVLVSVISVIARCVGDVYIPLYFQKVVDELTTIKIANSRMPYWVPIVIFVLLNAFQGVGILSISVCLQNLCWLPIDQEFRQYIQVKFLGHMHSMDWSYLLEKRQSDLFYILYDGTDSILSVVEHMIYSIVPTIVSTIIAIVYITVKFGWIFALVIKLQLIIYISFTLQLTKTRSIFQHSVNEAEEILRRKAMESVVNYETVKVYMNENFEKNRFSKSMDDFLNQKFRVEALTAMGQNVQHGIVCMGWLICLYFFSTRLHHGHDKLTAGDYVLLTMFLGQLYAPVRYLAEYYRDIKVSLVKAEALLHYIRQKPAIRDMPFSNSLILQEATVEFRNVCLKTDSGKDVLQNISFTIPSGQTTMLVGSSGSGKTSIARLLLRLLDPTFGEIFVGGINIRNVTLKSLRESIGFVAQDTVLLNDSILNNIRYGKADATEYEVQKAATMAQIYDVIMGLMNGYDTRVGEDGMQLSGGERQRIGIARALLKNPKILIFDEPTSALDANTEKRVLKTLSHLCKHKTCLVITHNLRSAINSDNIIVLESGRIIERGSYQTLCSNGTSGKFLEMRKNQNWVSTG